MLAAGTIDEHVTTDDLEQFGADADKVSRAVSGLVEELHRRAGYLVTDPYYAAERPRPTLAERVDAAEAIIAAVVDATGLEGWGHATELLTAYDRRYTTRLADRADTESPI